MLDGAAPGGGYDITARLMSPFLSERLGRPFIVENRPGAATTIGTEAVVKVPPDGYTLLLLGVAAVTTAQLYDKLSFDLIRDIAPIAAISREPHIMVVNPSVPASTVPEFIAYAKANPGKLSMASSGSGTPPHVAGELFKMMTGIDMVHVPYRGTAPALTDLLGGQVQPFGLCCGIISRHCLGIPSPRRPSVSGRSFGGRWARRMRLGRPRSGTTRIVPAVIPPAASLRQLALQRSLLFLLFVLVSLFAAPPLLCADVIFQLTELRQVSGQRRRQI